MREILFRGKWIGNGKWVEGYYCKISETTYAFAEDYERNPIPVHHYILQEAMTDWGLPNRFNQYEIDPKTLCQYTGLTDKNGNRIWENDIVDASGEWWNACGPAGHDSPIINVEWIDELTGFDPFANYDCDCGVYINANGCEVIGNIFDNPELLKGD